MILHYWAIPISFLVSYDRLGGVSGWRSMPFLTVGLEMVMVVFVDYKYQAGPDVPYNPSISLVNVS